MAFDHQSWNDQFLIDPDYNDAGNYGVGIFRHNPVSGERYWRIIGVHHLLPDENLGNHNLFFDVLDINGNRVRPIIWINWVWEGMRPEEQPPFAQGDKPDNEPAGNIALGWNQIVYAGCNGRNTTQDTDGKSDWIQKAHTNHPDEGDAEGNTIGHHSFYVMWQETVVGEVIPDPIPEPPIPDPDPIPNPPPNPGNVIGKVTIRDSLGPATFIVPWLANVYENSPEGTFLEAVVEKQRLQEMINKTPGDFVKIHVELQRDDRVP